MLELLAPAGSMEALTAAVQNGADAVYFGYGDFNARRGAKNFTREEAASAVSYCHTRGCRVNLTLNTLLTDRELPQAARLGAQASAAGVDAILVQDLGVARMLRQSVPDLPIHGSTQMTVHSLDGVKLCADLGMTRVVLGRELSRDQIAYICQNAPIEIEVFGHGALCMCWSGQCFFSSVIGGRSGNRGMCAQPCRLPYGWGDWADGHPLSLKDMSLAGHLEELRDMVELDMDTIDAIAIASGPGSFTGLRIGSATAKGLGLALGKPLVEVPTLEGLAWNLWGTDRLVCPLMDARRNQVYAAACEFLPEGEGFALHTVIPQTPIDIEELLEKLTALGRPVTFLGDGVPVYREAIRAHCGVPYALAPAGSNRQRAASIAALGAVYFRQGRIVPAAAHSPVYLRKSQAEREREEADGHTGT